MESKRIFPDPNHDIHDIHAFVGRLAELLSDYCDKMNAGQIISILVTHMAVIACDLSNTKESLLQLIKELIEQIDFEELNEKISQAKKLRQKND